MLESIEYRPPTQSQKPNMFSGSIPNAETSVALVETATKCRATAVESPPQAATSHSRALRALVIVSCVVKVFDEMMKSVVAASSPAVASLKSVPSTLETKRNSMSSVAKWRRAS